MVNVKVFVFNPFQENTYLLYDNTRECIIIDAGCYEAFEKQEIVNFIEENQLKPVKLYNTHCHIDHFLGTSFLVKKYNIGFDAHEKGRSFIKNAFKSASAFELQIEKPAEITGFINEGDIIKFGNTILHVLYTPGHADGSVCFVNKSDKFVITGDVLFNRGIGRTDFPTGNYELLIDSIKNKLFTLDDDYIVYPGHGPTTTIGDEKEYNPFF